MYLGGECVVLLIGASSFIGVYTVDAMLEAGYQVVGTGRNLKFNEYCDNKGATYLPLDISPKDQFLTIPNKPYKAAILLSALLPANDTANLMDVDHASVYIKVNTLGTIYLLEFCKKQGIKRIISTASYSDAIGSWNKDISFIETATRSFSMFGDHCEYNISQSAAEDFLTYYKNQYEMKNIVFRFPPVYGVGPHGKILDNGKIRKSGIQLFIDSAKEGRDI